MLSPTTPSKSHDFFRQFCGHFTIKHFRVFGALRPFIILFLIFCAAANGLLAQKKEVIIKDSTYTKSKKVKYVDPKKAMLYSIIPGGGQIYNGKAWKAPIVWAALGVDAYFTIDFYNQYLRYKREYECRINNGQCEETLAFLPNETIRAQRDQFDKWFQQGIFIGAGLYLLNMLEAYTDAHLRYFNVDDDLSFFAEPSNASSSGAAVGLSGSYLSFGIRYRLD